MPGPALASSMISPPPSCLSKCQLGMITSALQSAFNDNKIFNNAQAVDDYLREAGVREDLILAHDREIFDCYLRLQADAKNTQQSLLTSCNGVSQVAGSESNTDPEDHPDEIPPVAPTFNSQETFIISAFRPRFNTFMLLTAKTCTGRASYISERIAREHHLNNGSSSAILSWRYTGGPQSNAKFRTRCELVSSEWLPDCEVALGENFGTDDLEESEVSEKSSDSSNNFQPDDLVYESLETAAVNEYSPEYHEDLEHISTRVTTKMAFELSKLLVNAKRKTPQSSSSHFVSTSQATDRQYKRTRIV